MAIRDDVQARRWLVGSVELTNYRSRMGLKQLEIAKTLNVSAGLVSHYEQGKYLPEPDQVRAWLTACGARVEEIENLIELVSWPQAAGSWLSRWDDVIAPFMRIFVGCEGFCSKQFRYAPLVLPSLCQTEAYAAGMTAPSARVRPDQERRIVELRMERQRRLRDGDLHLTAVIEEDVLDRPAGNAGVMREQLELLGEMAEWDNCDILIIPTSVGRHDGLEGRFTVLHFEAGGRRLAGPIAYIEIPNDSVYKTRQDQVAEYTESAERIISAALSPAASLKAIESHMPA